MPTSNRWRLHVTANNGRSTLNIAEIEMRIALGGADQCTGGAASASSEFGAGYEADKAFDNDSATYWSSTSSSLPAWVEYQFGSSIEILEYTIQARSDVTDGAPKDWTLEFHDGSSWVVYHSVTGETTWALGETRTFAVEFGTGPIRTTQLAVETLHQATDPALRSTQLAVETLHQAANPSLRLTQLVMETLVPNPPPTEASITQGTLETLISPTPDARISQSTMEVLAAGFPDVWVSQGVLEVLIGLAPESENVCWIAIPIGIAMHKPIGRRI